MPLRGGPTTVPRYYAHAFRSLRSITRFLIVLSFVSLLLIGRIFYSCSPYVCARRSNTLVSHGPSYPQSGNVVHHEILDVESQRKGTKAIVVASLKGDNTSWVQGAFPEWEANVFVMDDQQAPLHVPENKGHESMAYLTYIIDHYDDLPDYLVFSHAERWQWHNDDPMYDGIPVIRKLQLPYVNKVGYTNLRCAWKLGCPVQVKPGRILSKIEAAFEPWNERANTEAVFGRSFRELFPDAEVPSAVGVPCGGQFAVARWKVLERPRGDYERFREWLLGTALPDSVSGRVLEYSWHMVFRMSPVTCPKTSDCYCQTFGLCNLTCSSDSCEGRYIFPPHVFLPKGWPEVGPGEDGHPDWGWDVNTTLPEEDG